MSDRRPIPRSQAVRKYAVGMLEAVAMSLACMSLFVATVLIAPVTAPILWVGAVIATAAGVRVIQTRVSGDTFLALLFFPLVMGLLHLLIAFQVAWTVGAIDL